MRWTIVAVLCVAYLCNGVQSCGGGDKREVKLEAGTRRDINVNKARATSATNDDLKMIRDTVGEGVTVGLYNDVEFMKEAGGPVNMAEKLSCSMDTSDKCCWENVDSPQDQLQWAKATGTVNAAVFDAKFNHPSRKPQGSFLMILGSTSASDEGHFSSCSVPCAKSNITVTLSHWQTKNVLLQVCTRAAFDNGRAPLTNCREVIPRESPGPSTVILPSSKLVNIVILATNLIDPSADAAIIDDIKVDYDVCDDQSIRRNINTFGNGNNEKVPAIKEEETVAKLPVRPITSTNGVKPATYKGKADNCLQVPCDFENEDLCAYLNVAESGFIEDVNTLFEVHQGQFQNQVTGIPGASSGQKYAAAFLKEGEKSALQTLANFTAPVIVSIDHYVATSGIVLMGCCDTPDNCPLKTSGAISAADREWKTTKFTCPKETGQLLFICSNTASNQGTCAIDNIHLMVPASGGTQSQVKLC